MTRLYLVRHCEAEGNIYRRVHGITDSLVTPKGRRQIAALAERFRDEPVDAVYASNLRRTQETAGAILRYHPLSLQIEPDLHEVNTGVWEDRPFGDVARESPEQLHYFNEDPIRWSVEGCEPFPALQARLRSAVDAIAARHPGQTVVCVSHGMAIRALLASYLKVPSAQVGEAVPHGDNTAVSLLEFDGGGVRVVYMNDTSHLPEELSTFARQTWWKERNRPDRGNIHFRRFDPRKQPRKYIEYYEKSWLAVHGSLRDFTPGFYLRTAEEHAARCPDALVTIHRPDGTPVGLIELDTERGAEEGSGWICLCFVEEEARRGLLGVQLIGHAVSLFRRLGRSSIRLSVYEGNEGAIRFYESCEFAAAGSLPGSAGRLLVMEKELG